ncbi:MAG: hypothetical protein Q9227_005215 [Pyrenula ochraceoflavens]
MSRLQSFLTVILLITAVIAAPAPQKRSFKVARLRQRNYVANGPRALARAYAKYGINMPNQGMGLPALDFSSKTNLKLSPIDNKASNGTGTGSEDGTVTATGTQNDSEFLSPVQVGGQTMVMDFDSGSSDMWVFNTQLPANQQGNHTLFDPSKSTTFQQMQGATFNISYGDGSFASGPVGMDQVDIGGATVQQQAIGVPDQVSDSFVKDGQSNGLVGLAFSQLNTIQPQQQKTFFANVAPQLSSPVFTANFKQGQVGNYEFGNIDTTQFQGQLTNVPVNTVNGFWQVDSKSFSVNGGQPQTAQGGSGTAIADTGTSLMLVDAAVVNAYYSQVDQAQNSAQVGGVVFPCNSQLPDLAVAMGDNYMATVPGTLMKFASVGQDQTGTNFCFGGLQSNQGANLQIYGDVFFKSQFVAFQGTNPPTLGLAPHA